MQRHIIGLGEALWDVLPEGKQLGGAPANFAYHAQQFGHSSLAISALGTDALGTEVITTLDARGMNYLMPRVDYPTGTVQVNLDDEGVPTYEIREGVAWDNIPYTAEIAEAASAARAICFGSLAQRSAVSRSTIQQCLAAAPADCLKIFDINLRQNFYTREVIERSMHACNILKINDEELIALGRMFGYPGLDIEDKCWLLLGKYHLDMLVLTCGVNGSYVFAPGTTSFQETPRVVVADTVGAGDSFTATFISAILAGRTIPEAHKLAVEVSAYVCTQAGAMPLLPEEFTSQLR